MNGPVVPDTAPEPPADECAAYLKALADPVRLRIVKALQAGPLTVSDIADLVELALPNASHHLRVLYNARLVTIEKDGKYSYYRLNKLYSRGRTSTGGLDFGCCRIDLRSTR
jgi:DNA-binding transcriptional ArsR family regulator